ncbi:hypothetical protein HNR60_002168 [Rhodopseudomonas rhenobacensis]|uniref:Uncharacterized protein n=1 Tax=Rhodopseudomonas rhenobacensis TaxID=87461 RepID=A0A7W7Z3Z7_9BRAD|nr:hypothetical protein [Rhodopseudomonas rhenobacensis]MBB5047413.1 hypothetical protein [Rhodopseudomonas rhenobacensis]
MDQEPSDRTISTLVEIARSAGLDLNPAQQDKLAQLLGDGLIELAGESGTATPRYAVTPKGQSVLDERGIGANES